MASYRVGAEDVTVSARRMGTKPEPVLGWVSKPAPRSRCHLLTDAGDLVCTSAETVTPVDLMWTAVKQRQRCELCQDVWQRVVEGTH
jgi:hypothetical protein